MSRCDKCRSSQPTATRENGYVCGGCTSHQKETKTGKKWGDQPFDFTCDRCSRTINRKQTGKLRKVKRLRTVTTKTTPATTTTTITPATETVPETVVVTTTPATVTTTVKTLILKRKKSRRVISSAIEIKRLKTQVLDTTTMCDKLLDSGTYKSNVRRKLLPSTCVLL